MRIPPGRNAGLQKAQDEKIEDEKIKRCEDYKM
jgi:hypothetical protein